MKKKIGLVLLMVLCAMMIFAAGSQESDTAPAEEKAVTIVLASVDTVGSLRNLMGEELKKEIAAHPELNVSVKHVEGPVLGNAGQVMDQVVEGSVQLLCTDLAWFAPFDQDLSPTSFGYIFRDETHIRKYLASNLFTDVVDRIASEKGLRLTIPTPFATRVMFTTKPLNSADDLVGLKMRAPGLEMFIESYKAYGMSPTAISWSEIFLALKTGVADGAQGVVADMSASKWHLSAPYITKLSDMYSINGWFTNDAFWKSLSDNQRAGLTAAMDKVGEWGRKQSLDNESSLIDGMVSEGAIFNNSFPAEDAAKIRAKALNAARRLEANGKWSAGLIDAIDSL